MKMAIKVTKIEWMLMTVEGSPEWSAADTTRVRPSGLNFISLAHISEFERPLAFAFVCGREG